MSDLAIVIPAYKDTYFDKALNSIAEQSNKNFKVYIGDDCSPFDLQTIVDRYKDKININYTRFPANIGAKDLVLQWKRCIELTEDEKWLWLFSDDDIMDKNCVEQFYLTIAKKLDRFDVYRFNLTTIDASDNILYENLIGPEEESSAQMAYNLFRGQRSNSMPDHIFTRNIYNLCGGFVETAYAQGADWGTSILFSKDKGLSTIPGAKIYWRYSGKNITSTASKNKSETISGHLQFTKWVAEHFRYLKHSPQDIGYKQMLVALRGNLTGVMVYHYKGINAGHTLSLFNIYHKYLGLSFFRSFIEVIKIQQIFNGAIKKLYLLHRWFISLNK